MAIKLFKDREENSILYENRLKIQKEKKFQHSK